LSTCKISILKIVPTKICIILLLKLTILIDKLCFAIITVAPTASLWCCDVWLFISLQSRLSNMSSGYYTFDCAILSRGVLSEGILACLMLYTLNVVVWMMLLCEQILVDRPDCPSISSGLFIIFSLILSLNIFNHSSFLLRTILCKQYNMCQNIYMSSRKRWFIFI